MLLYATLIVDKKNLGGFYGYGFGIATEGFSYPDNFDEDNEEIAKLFVDR